MITRRTTIISELQRIGIIIFGAATAAFGLNFFLIPADVFASGLTGVAQFVNALIPISTGVLLLVLNIPVAILGWIKVGRLFTFYSFLHVALTSFFLEIIPVQGLTGDIMLNAVFGGIIVAIGTSLPLRFGASAGGLDIIALVLARMSDRPVGAYFFMLNALIVVSAGFAFDWEQALFTLVSIYASSRIIDMVHTRHVKCTALIITKKADILRERIHEHLTRGITRMPAKGGFDASEKEVLMIVITRYELYTLRQITEEADPEAFTNIVPTTEILGSFRKDD
ncbi:membrane protein [Geomicrobium sp. JCM 19037]|uniref:YitT family protein n=1 Tax=unclassified Geomicrobium TaxID=2628951 RepID=UPI00045F1997|nr:YitT family protein [Geomicrobium sp. JCM 19037]GAK05757.1 membrane protein [Geomicrobium sp. JCM 19037]